MIKGIGVDTTDIREIDKLILQCKDAFLIKTFTKGEMEQSKKMSNQIEYFATRFAAKEAVFKALAHLTKAKCFDFRIVETLNREDGSPFINVDVKMKTILAEADVADIMISLTTECNFATAFVIVQ